MFSIVLRLFKIGGILHFFNRGKVSKYYPIYSCILIFHAVLIFVLEALEVRNTINDYKELMDQLIFFPVHLITIIKSTILCANHKKVNRIMESLTFEYNFLKSFGGEFERKIEAGVRRISIVSSGYVYIISTMAVITIGFALLNIVRLSPDDFASGNVQCRKLLILHSMIPFSTSTKWFCAAGCIFQLTALLIYIIHIQANDTFYVILLLHLKVDVEVLRKLFATIKSRSLEKLNLPKEYGLLYDEWYPELGNITDQEMRTLTMSLQRLLKISDDIESIFRYITLMQVAFSLFNMICCLFVTAVTVEPFSTEFFVQAQVYFGFAGQLAIYCVFADNTSTAFAGIPFAIYQNSWFSASRNFKRMMIMNILRMNRPVLFTAGKFVGLNLPLLVWILRMSYSFYTVLRK